jgi:DNA-binding NtrC family response regulator
MPASILFHSQIQTPPPRIEHQTHPAAVSLDERLHEVETHLIAWALKINHGNKSKAAELLQIKRSTLGDRIRKLGLDHLEEAES